MVKDRIESAQEKISQAINNVRQSDLLKNIAVGDYFLKKYGLLRENIKFIDLAKIPVGKSLPLPSVKGGSIITTNVTRNTHGLSLHFEVVWTPGATLIMHKHSDAQEKIKIRCGLFQLIIEDKEGKEHRFTLKSGDVIDIGAGQYHQLTALEKGRMKIKFTKV